MGWELVIINLVCGPGGKAFLKDRAYMFGDEFRQYIENDLMKEGTASRCEADGRLQPLASAPRRCARSAPGGGPANFAIVIGGIVGENIVRREIRD